MNIPIYQSTIHRIAPTKLAWLASREFCFRGLSWPAKIARTPPTTARSLPSNLPTIGSINSSRPHFRSRRMRARASRSRSILPLASPPKRPLLRTFPFISETVTPDADNIVRLPEGVSIDEIKLDGDNLVLVQPDGSSITILNAALRIPTFLIGDVEIPELALTAALQANGIDVAAGPRWRTDGRLCHIAEWRRQFHHAQCRHRRCRPGNRSPSAHGPAVRRAGATRTFSGAA